MNIATTSSPAGQDASLVNQWLSVLADAARHVQIDPAEAAQMNSRFAAGQLTPDEVRNEVRRTLARSPLAERAIKEVAAAFRSGDVIELRALDPAGGGGASCFGRIDDPAERRALEEFVRSYIGERNLYVGVNPRRPGKAGLGQAASASDVVGRRVVVLDLDYKDAPATDPDWTRTVDALGAGLFPLLIVQSGNGVHVWLEVQPVAEADVAAAAGPLAAAMARLGADNMADPARIIRLPWTVNLPTESKRKRGASVRLAVTSQGHVQYPRVMCPPAPPVADLCATLTNLARRLGLPGKGKSAAASAASYVGANGATKTPTAAPSAALLQMALAELPNHPGGPFDHRSDWVAIAHAVKGASVAGGIEAEGRDAFVEWSQQWGGDPDEPGRVWDGITNPHSGWGTVMRALEDHNPAGAARVKQEAARAAFSLAATTNFAQLSAAQVLPVQPFNPKALRPRQWLYARTYVRGAYSMLVASGGSGKSALAMVEAVALASGRELLSGERPVNGPKTVLLHNGEDSEDEQQKRLAAAMIHHGVTHAELAGRLILTSGHDHPIKLGRMGSNGPELTPGAGDWIVETARRLGVDVLILDPLGAIHGLPENSNEAINLLAGGLRRIAVAANIAVVIVHHVSQAAASNMQASGANAARGATALVDAARIVRQISRLDATKEAPKFGIKPSECWRYLRVVNGKANMSAIAGENWVRLASVKLGNVTPDYPSGDEVQTVERWTPPEGVAAAPGDLTNLQNAIRARAIPPRYAPQSPDWVGFLLAEVMGLDAGRGLRQKTRTEEQAYNFAQVNGLIRQWIASGGLRIEQRPDPKKAKNETTDFVVVGLEPILGENPDTHGSDGSGPPDDAQDPE